MRKNLWKQGLAVAMAAAMMVSAVPENAVLAATQQSISTYSVNENEEYQYVYAGLSWAQYWEAEGVYAAGNTDSSEEKDSKGELDKGGYDAVTRATANHGLHRGSFQCDTIIYGEKGEYEISHWEDNGATIVLTDGSKIGFSRGVITLADGTTDTMTHYEVKGIKYVPVKVKTSDYKAFCEAYQVVENGDTLSGGYGEMNLKEYSVTANVTENTNGLKTAVQNADGSFSFTSRMTGSDSGVKDTALAKAENITYDVKKTESDTPGASTTGAYGEFLRVDLTGDGYGSLGSAMQAVKWTYYGNDSSRTNALASYGTKFAADNWMHKVNGIQLGLTDSIRCQLPEGYDGTGYWSLTVYALGYEDYTVNFEATTENILNADAEEADTTQLAEVIAQAKGLKEADYTVDSWKQMQMELEESEELIADENCTQAAVDEQISHLKQAIESLELKGTQTITTSKSDYIVTYGDAAFSLGAQASGTLSYQSSNANTAEVNAKGQVTIKGAGTANITISAAQTDSQKAASKTVTVTVKKKIGTISGVSSTYSKAYGASAFNLGAKTNATKLIYSSSNKNVAAVTSAGKVTIKGTGIAKITIKTSDANFTTVTKTVTIKAAPKKQTVKLTSAKKKQLTVQVTKDTKASGYEIQISTNSKFTKSATKTYKITSYNTLKKTISSVTSGKKYYVRTRSYKTSGSEKVYGAYSTVKNIKVK